MAIINIENMFKEIISLMKNNFQGTPTERFEQAKEQYLENIGYIIEANKKGFIEEVKE